MDEGMRGEVQLPSFRTMVDSSPRASALAGAQVDEAAEVQHAQEDGVERPVVEPAHARRPRVVPLVQHVHAVTEPEQIHALAHLHRRYVAVQSCDPFGKSKL
jgi:hypothetical protein